MSVNSNCLLVAYSTAYGGGYKSRISTAMSIPLMLVLALLFSMWDFYLPQLGLRVLDFVGTGLLCFWILWKLSVDMRGVTFRTPKFQLLALMIAWNLVLGIVGLMGSMENVKPIAGILMGVAVFSFFYSIRLDGRSVAKSLGIVIVIHASYLIFQYLYYEFFGVVINLYGFLGGEEPRAISSIFRPTGWFLEPAAYSASILMLLTVRIFITKCFDKITLLALATIFLTLSLWGLLAGIIFIFLFSKKNILFFIVVALLIFLVLPALSMIVEYWVNANDNPLMRLINLGDDSSATVRYYALINAGTNATDVINLLFGKGLSNEYHEFGSSGLAFILSAGGLFGTGVFLLILFRIIPRDRRFLTLTLILLFLTSAPILTTAYWWFCLALMLRRFECEDGQESRLRNLKINLSS